MKARLLLLVAGLVYCGVALAHPLAPALLEMREVGSEAGRGRYEVLWRTSIQRAQFEDVTPRLPAACTSVGGDPVAEPQGRAISLRWTVQCAGALAGQTLQFGGLERSGLNVIVRIEPLGRAAIEALLDARHAVYVVPEPATRSATFPRYFGLGVGHLLGGLDHLLFVAGLVLLISGWRRLLLAVTAFTVGHSVTLVLATLGYANVNPALTEFGIALSILVLACELARPNPDSFLRRRPGTMAASFGLVHGLGFAGALAQVGLPGEDIVPALLAFNLGIEVGQLGVVALLSAIGALARGNWGNWGNWGQSRNSPKGRSSARCRPNFDSDPNYLSPNYRLVPVYLIGTLAAYWCFERASVALA